MATFHQNLVQSFLNFKNKYLRQYDTYEDAVDDIDNIPEGGIFYTNDNASVQDIIDGMTAIHLVGSQIGSGSNNIIFNTESHKRMLIITKKSGVIVESKEIPTDVLSTGDVIPLGNTAPIIGTTSVPSGITADTDLVGKEVFFFNGNTAGTDNTFRDIDGTARLDYPGAIGLAADLSDATRASLTYNGNDSFTVSVTDSTLSVYVYIDMLVLGGSASGRNVSFDAAGTSLESTDVEGAIKELRTLFYTAPVNIISTNPSAVGNFNLTSELSNYKAIVVECYRSGTVTTQMTYIPVARLIKDTTTSYETFIDNAARTNIRYVNNTTLKLNYNQTTDVSIKGVWGIK